jgi:hypothetical protein
MDPRTAAAPHPDPDAVAFVRFCYHRRRVGWPELYDEMCAVAARGLYRGYGSDDLADLGIGFGLFDMPALATLANRIVEEERASRRPMTVVIADPVEVTAADPAVEIAAAPDPTSFEVHVAVAANVAAATDVDVEAHVMAIVPETRPSEDRPSRPEPAIRFVPVPAGA